MANSKKDGLNRNWLYRARFSLAYLVIALLILGGFFLGLSTLPSGLSRIELIHIGSIDAFSQLIDNPINPITRVLQILSLKVFGLSELGLRLGTAVIAAAAMVTFFAAMRKLYWPRKAIVGTFLFASSSWILHHARFGEDSISIVLIISLFILTTYQAAHTRKLFWVAAAAATTAIGLYTPLFIYVVLATAIMMRREIIWLAGKTKRINLVLPVLGALVLLSPLLVAIVRDIDILKQILNIPADLPTIREYAENISDTFSYVFWRSFESPSLHLAQLPMLDVFTVAMVALGLYEFERSWPARRSKLVFVSMLFLLLAVSLQLTEATALALAPFVYLLAANGVSTLLMQWHSIFPRNPIARTLGLAPLGMVMILVFFYHYNRYFVAWPNTAEAKEAFDQRPTKINADLESKTSESILVISRDDERAVFGYLQTSYDNVKVVTASELRQEDLTSSSRVYITETAITRRVVFEEFGQFKELVVGPDRDQGVLYRIFYR